MVNTLENRLAHLSPAEREQLRARVAAQIRAKQQHLAPPEPSVGGVAIIGLSGQFPGAVDATTFWHNLTQGVDSLGDIPPERWDHRAYFDPTPGQPNKTYSQRGGFLDNIDQFDPLFFNISPAEAEAMDPQQRLFLQEAYHTFENAGYAPDTVSDCGVFVGVWQGDYGLRASELSAPVMNGSANSILASRVAYILDLSGPCVALDTACSSSLTAMHMACQSLQSGDCRLALAGGVHIMTTPRLLIATSQMEILSPSGQCRPFDAAADGWVMSEAVGAVLLKPLKQAIADGDHIYAVIRGSGINQNGRSIGPAAPRASAQTQLQQRVYRQAGISPATIDYIEMQGVSDRMSDAIEFDALRDTFQPATNRPQSIALGTVKPNMGHALTASGIAAMVKVLLAFEHQTLPPSHVETPNPELDVKHSPFYFNTALTPWPKPDSRPRRAAVNGFGMSGTNAHLILEEYPQPPPIDVAGPHLIALSARTVARLHAVVDNLHRFLSDAPPAYVTLAAVAYTLQVGRDALPVRAAFVVHDWTALLTKLAAFRNETPPTPPDARPLAATDQGRAIIERSFAIRDLEKLAFFWRGGVTLDWMRLYNTDRPPRIPLPTYPFEQHSYWLDSKPQIVANETLSAVRQVSASANLQQQVTQMVAEVVNVTDLDPAADFHGYGLDSLMGLQLRRKLATALSVNVTSREVAAYSTIQQLTAHLEQKLKAPVASPVTAPDRSTTGITGPLSAGQTGLWLLQTFNPDLSAYNVPVAFHIRDALNAERWQTACEFLRTQYPILQTVICTEEGQPYQTIDPAQPLGFEVVDMHYLSEAEVIPHLQARVRQPFDLATGPLMRVQLFSRGNAEYILLLTFHHIILDGTALRRLLQTLFDAYCALSQGKTPAAVPIAASYHDFVAWEQAFLASDAGRQHLDYWRTQLSGEIPLLALPLDAPRPPIQQQHGEFHRLPLTTDITAQVQAFARQNRVSVATVMMAAFKALLHRYTGQRDILIGTPSLGRPEPRFEQTIGYFINMLVIRSTVNGEDTFRDYLTQLQLTLLDALDHSAYPFPRLVTNLNINRDMATHPLFQVAFAFQNYTQLAHLDPDVLPGDYRFELHQTGEFDLELEVLEVEQGYQLNFKYNPDIFHAPTIKRLATHYVTLLNEAIAAPDSDIAAYPLLAEAERQMMLHNWNATAADYPRDMCMHALVEAQAQQRPNDIVVTFEDTSLTYHQLSEQSTRLAHYLQGQGVQPDTLVGVCMDRSAEMVVALLGILKAGGAYVPIEPAYPAARAGYMLEDSGVKLVITEDKHRAMLMPLLPASDCQLVLLTEALTTPAGPLETRVEPHHLAYVMYTSGSTGKPKGVMIEHRTLTNFLISMTQKPGFQAGQRLLAVTTYCFDISLLELFTPLINGGEVILLSAEVTRNAERLKQALAEYRPDVMQATPATWLMLFESGWTNAEQVTILCGGEALSNSLRQKFHATNSRVWNMFGPTETTIWSTTWPVQYDGPITIGKPINNTQIYILDNRQQPVPIGVTGALYIAGDGLARGYHNRADLTAEKFVANPFTPGTKMYNTGDLARWLTDGTIEFLGRVDHQVKIRGFRIELGEIESALAQFPGLQIAVVVAKTDQHGEKYLCAYYTADTHKTPLELRDFLAEFLPPYMIPARFIWLEDVPLNTSGKVDRGALMRLAVRSAAPTETVQPTNAIERKLATIWQDVLNLETVGIHDKFFEIGGNSLLIVRVFARLQTEFNAPNLNLTTLFKYPTIHELSHHLAKTVPALPADAVDKSAEPAASPTDDALAIIGMACRFPDAADYRAFWDNLLAGHESIHIFTAADLAARNVPPEVINHPNYVGSGFELGDTDVFDANFFQISPRNALLMDPQARLLLEQCWATIEDAGYTPDQIADAGVFVTASTHPPTFTPHTEAEQYISWMMHQGGTLPTTISYKLGFSGPSMFIHTNCSSALTALQVAARSLKQGDCAVALIGASSLNPMTGYIYQKSMNFSSDGHCKAFDATADGMVMGEGVGAILVKPLPAALRDNDQIYAVVRGISINNDSSHKVGYYAPSIQGQAAVIQQALDASGIDPNTIGYIEAHGTGTALGDPIEVAALTEAYRVYTERRQFCALGSVKTNIGHLDTAAGLAGLIKATLALKHQHIPPSLNFTQPNPAINFEASPFYVVTEPTAWHAPAHPRRAAVSSLGVGGTNAHVIIEEWPQPVLPPVETGDVLIPLSAKQADGLHAYAQRFRTFLAETPDVRLVDVAYTLQIGRTAMPHRVAFIARDVSDLITQFDTFLKGEPGRWYQGEVADDATHATSAPTTDLPTLAKRWVHGTPIDWLALYDLTPRRISLPTYPFARERHVLPIEKLPRRPDKLHPLLHRDVSTADGRQFTATFTATEFFLGEHRVNGAPVLPGVAYLEMAYAAAQLTGQTVAQVKNVVWIQPLRVEHGPTEVYLTLNEDTTYQVKTGTTLHAQGKIIYGTPAEPPAPIHIDSIRRACPQHQPAEALYQGFAQHGVDYGPNFRVITNLHIGESQALAQVALSGQADPAYYLHPAIFDGALQAVIGMMQAQPTTEARQYLPFALDKATLYRPLPAMGYVYVEKTAEQPDAINFTMKILDEHGHICVDVHEFVVRAATPPPSRVQVRPQTQRIQRDHIAAIITEQLAEALYTDADAIDLHRRFIDLGLDSILGIQLVTAINETLNIDIPVTKIYEHSSVADLADYILPLVGLNAPPQVQHSPDTTPPHPLASGQTETITLDPRTTPYLRDHLIYGEPTLPFDAYVELLYTGARQRLNTPALSLREVHILAPLVAREPVQLELQYRQPHRQPQPDAAAIQFRAASTRLHVKGLIEPLVPQVIKNTAYEPILTDYEHLFTQADLYHGESIAGQPGPFYQSITALKIKGQTAVSQLKLSPQAMALHAEYSLQPALINGLLVTALNFAWHVHNTDAGVFLPVLIDAVHIYQPPTPGDYVGYVTVRSAEVDWVKFDADLIDSSGTVVLSIKGLQVKNIKPTEFAPSGEPALQPTPAQNGIAPQLTAAPASRKIAIIGMSGQFAEAETLAQFWDNLADGVDTITEIPLSRWDYKPFYMPGEPQPNKTYHKWGGFLRNVGCFDPTFFNISPLEAEQMDPQQRLFLQACWASLEDAGYGPALLSNVRCGVFVGTATSDYGVLLSRAGLDSTAQAFMGTSSAILASRISYILNLTGPSLAVDTACSSSLVAIHQACQSILHGESDMALAGGVTLIFTPQYHIKGSHSRILSPTGRCRPFDQKADGVSWGEGVGVVVLKPYEAARRDKDPIYGVILASGTNQDGQTNGITAPSGKSQRELEIRVYEQAGINPETITCIEAHGTGTRLGDPVEVHALTEAFRHFTAAVGFCALGSVKSNIGHTTMASGVAGIIKMLLAFQHRQIPPSINFDTPNEHIKFKGSPFYVNTTLRPWEPSPGVPRRGAVSSFGFGGTNCHILLEEPPALPMPAIDSTRPQVFVLSARTAERLGVYVQQMLNFLGGAGDNLVAELRALVAELLNVAPAAIEPDQPLAEYGLDQLQMSRLHEAITARYNGTVSTAALSTSINALASDLVLPPTTPDFLAALTYTLQVGRDSMAHRLACVVSSTGELQARLQAYLSNQSPAGLYQGRVKGRRATHPDPIAPANPDEVAREWVAGATIDWQRLAGPEPPRRLHLPTYPFAKEHYWIPDVAAPAPPGSSGQLHPLVHRNVSDATGLHYESTLTGREFFLADHVVQKQPTLPGVAYLEMARAAGELARPGEAITNIRDIVWLHPIRIDHDAVTVQTTLSPGGDGTLRYEIKSNDVRRAAGILSYETRSTFAPLNLPAIRQRCPRSITPQAAYRLFQQQGVEYGPAFQAITEIARGDGEALVRLHLPDTTTAAAYGLHPSLLDGALQSLIALVDDTTDAPLYLPFSIRALAIAAPLPATCYVYVRLVETHAESTHLDMTLTDEHGQVCVALRDLAIKAIAQPASQKETLWPEDEFYYQTFWESQPLAASKPTEEPALIISNGDLPDLVAQMAQQHAQPVIHAVLGAQNLQHSAFTWNINPADAAGLVQLVAAQPDLKTIYFLGGLSAIEPAFEDVAGVDAQQERGVLSLFRLIKALDGADRFRRLATLKVVTHRTQAVYPSDPIVPWGAALGGLTLSIAKEYPTVDASWVDVALTGGQLDPRDVAAVLAEHGSEGYPVAVRNGQRYMRQFAHVSLPPLTTRPYRRGGVYLILGGAGGIGLETSVHLAQHAQAKVVLVGRSPLTPETTARLERIRVAGGDYLYCRADGTDLLQMQDVIQQAQARFGPINGVIHSAIVLKDAAIHIMDEATFQAALAPKIRASAVLYQAVKHEPLDFMLFYSSVQSFWGNAGQSNYSAGSMFKDAFALALSQQTPFPVKIINWGYWGYVGVVASEAYRQRLARQGIYPITTAEGMAALDRILSGPLAQVATLKMAPEVLARANITRRRVEALPVAPMPTLTPMLDQMKAANLLT